jgi:hypothetical protein
VEVTPPPSTAGCEQADAAWPHEVSGLARRDTSPSAPNVAAWGDPAVIALCGVPALPPTTEECVSVSGVDWVAHRLSDGVRFTTFGTDPAIEVLVPEAYAPEPLLLPAFGAAASALPPNGRHCD